MTVSMNDSPLITLSPDEKIALLAEAVRKLADSHYRATLLGEPYQVGVNYAVGEVNDLLHRVDGK